MLEVFEKLEKINKIDTNPVVYQKTIEKIQHSIRMVNRWYRIAAIFVIAFLVMQFMMITLREKPIDFSMNEYVLLTNNELYE
jgi:hypothetical protein